MAVRTRLSRVLYLDVVRSCYVFQGCSESFVDYIVSTSGLNVCKESWFIHSSCQKVTLLGGRCLNIIIPSLWVDSFDMLLEAVPCRTVNVGA